MTGIPQGKRLSCKFCDLTGMLHELENFGTPTIGTKKKPFPVFGGSGCFLGVEPGGLSSSFVCART